jgi:[NiFe] hydrogenase assembly HybE family chaperone
MSTATFEAHGLSALDSLPPSTRFECGVCWRVYDPAEGDDYWQIPAGTSFAGLPEHWTCPNCDTPREKFVALDLTSPELEFRLERLTDRYKEIGETQMKDLPVFNDKLRVETIGFRPFGNDSIGISISPWFMNVTIIPGNADSVSGVGDGDKVLRALPAGDFEFVMGRMEGVGPVLSCSLFSPMTDFMSHAAAQETAIAALAALFNKNIDNIEVRDEPAKEEKAKDRRELIFGRRSRKEDNA